MKMKKYFLFSVVFLFLNLRIVSAQIPECTYPIISSCPCNITLSGVWYQLNDTIYSNGTCIYVGKNEVAINCNHNRIVGNGSGNGLDIRDKMVIYIANCSIENFKYGIYGVRSSYIKIASSIFKNNYIGVKAEGNDHYYIGHNIFTNNSIGLYLVSDQSIVWDNYFSKNKIYNVLDASSILWRNSWNITKSTQDPFWPKRQAPNIIHGPFLGGNYYNITDYNGTDEDGDGLGEEIYYPPPAWYPENISDQHPLVDNIGPKYKELSIQGDSIYSPNKLYEFSITFEDNAELNEVFFELDNVNYTPEKEGEYLGFDSDLRVLHSVNYSIKFTGLGAGTHYYRWYGSDPRNNQNSTELISFTVEKATPILHLEINGNESDQILPYGSLVNVTAWVELEDSQDMNFNLYLNDTLIGSGNLISEQYYLSPGVYLYTYNTTGNANYSSNSISRMVIIKDYIPPYYSNIIEPQDPSFYNPSATYTFKIDWFDDVEVDKVILEMDGKNYTPTKSGNTYSFTFSSCPMSSSRGGGGGGGSQIRLMSLNPIPLFTYLLDLLIGRIVKGEEMPCLGVGIHYYKWYANDTSNNW
ncbi:MAG: NosD domain-containing protein, partial [Candidatus Aenigmatarchaeota archaeon]